MLCGSGESLNRRELLRFANCTPRDGNVTLSLHGTDSMNTSLTVCGLLYLIACCSCVLLIGMGES